MNIKNCPDCCFMGDIDDDKTYPFGVLTEKESDVKYAKKEVEAEVKALQSSNAKKVDNADFNSFKEQTSSNISTINVNLSQKTDKTDFEAFENKTDSDIETLFSDADTKASKEELQRAIENINSSLEGKASTAAVSSLENLVSTKASGAELMSLANTVDGKVDKSSLTYVTPEEFGAVGDGIADDTDAFLQAVESGKNIFISKNYVASLGNTSKAFTIIGSNDAKIICNKPFIDIDEDASGSLPQIKLLNVNFVCNRTNVIKIKRNVTMYNDENSLVVDGCKFTTPLSNNVFDSYIRIENVSEALIVNSQFINTYRNGVSGIAIEQINGINNRFNSNTMWNLEKGIYIHNSDKFSCEGTFVMQNVMMQCTRCVEISPTTTRAMLYFDLSHNMFDQFRETGVYLGGASQIHIHDNWIGVNQSVTLDYACITLKSTIKNNDFVTIENNTLQGTNSAYTEKAILINGGRCTALVVRGNNAPYICKFINCINAPVFDLTTLIQNNFWWGRIGADVTENDFCNAEPDAKWIISGNTLNNGTWSIKDGIVSKNKGVFRQPKRTVVEDPNFYKSIKRISSDYDTTVYITFDITPEQDKFIESKYCLVNIGDINIQHKIDKNINQFSMSFVVPAGITFYWVSTILYGDDEQESGKVTKIEFVQ